ncbi:MAG: tetratricopeptide repeat protein [Corticimicrobacter sp.]|uniref:tetratricopeptide repeat protein n=1 Tax=Corticimicrobacter sp. TaxID=2678536 RepID=UPI0032DA5167
MKTSLKTLCAIALVAALGGCASLGGTSASTTAAADKELTGSLAEGLRLARMLRDNGRMEGAAGIYARLDQRGELKGALLLEYATVAATVSSPRQALALFGRARQEMGGDPMVLPPATGVALCNGLGRARLALGQTDAALGDFDCALKLDAVNTVALNGKAVILDAQGEHEQAQALWRQAQEIDPADFTLLNNLALSYLSQGKTDETIRLLRQLDMPRNMPTLTLNLALAYLLENQPEQADQALRQLVSERQAEQLQAQLMRYSTRIREGEPVAAELLVASRQMLALQDQDE